MTDPEVSVRAGRAVARLARQVERALDGVGLSLPQYRLLALLAGSEEMASSLADLLAVRPPSVTALVDGLVGRGLVERQVAAHDRRCVSHLLTGDGREVLGRADVAVCARLAALAGHLDEGAAEVALDGLEHWADALDTARDRAVAARTDASEVTCAPR